MTDAPLLEVSDLVAGYGRKEVLHGVGLRVDAGEIVTLMGHNGAGKTTTIRSILGAVRPRAGTVRITGRDTTRRPVRRAVAAGAAMIPSERFVFPDLSVHDNLLLGAANAPSGTDTAERLATVRDLFPILEDRAKQPAGSMSGGQQRMVSLGMALMACPKLLLLDEPSLGLAPSVVETIFGRLRSLADHEDLGILLLEQNIKQALQITDRAYVMRSGQIILEEPAAKMRQRPNFWDLF
ncbi:ABC transporter ATP-binding protein [Actinomadura livida]|uniref:ABC transporter ATP-binding protein n=1 Tax=Actinomadura livida TaxID=79909 RepID=A0A7W7I8T3_9ACTN|nr:MULTISPECIES: ABC transporter ATP-binding protein [Actinomadura]MBB4772540.1 branched-chain amino acid transport system ATP-binding protein [Actinomadura catellatispora]GGU22328.1 ABC transporter ATP-binding protein [Actinomadura livida]